MLSSTDIRAALHNGDIGITPFDEARLQPASVDLTLYPIIRRPKASLRTIDLRNVQPGHTSEHHPGDAGHSLMPGEAMLGCTEEVVRIGRNLVGRVEGKSSLARLFLMVHVTGGFIDPGFEGQITLEIVNLSPWTIMMHPGQAVCQIGFARLERVPALDYASTGRYQGQQGATESRYAG